jgi:hypothetical protein
MLVTRSISLELHILFYAACSLYNTYIFIIELILLAVTLNFAAFQALHTRAEERRGLGKGAQPRELRKKLQHRLPTR